MVELWFGIVAVMLTLYVVLDGFDLGAGALHLLVARTDQERRQVLAAIGPFWDGNEVWLLASGGALFVAFPRVLAVGLSGFYFAIFLVLWCLILRGASIEFRSHVREPMWRAFWDAIWCASSALLAVFFGAALGNLIRGLPIGPDGWFHLPLFTDWSARSPVGILDWYTALAGAFALGVLALHGACYLAWRTEGPVRERSRTLAGRLAIGLGVAWPALTVATLLVHPDLAAAFWARPLAWLGLGLGALGVWAFTRGLERGREGIAFAGTSAWIAGLMIATAACLYPVMLRSLPDAGLSITAPAAANDAAGLRTALGWWVLGFPLAGAYLVALFRLHRGKATAARDREGY